MSIADVEGIGPAYAGKLAEAGVNTVDDLLGRGGTKAGREQIAAASGVSETLVLEWVNHADLMRVDGVGSEYSDLLEAAGVDSVVELSQRNAANLTAALATANEQRSLVRRLPTESEVARWSEHAGTLDRAIHH